MNLLRKQFLKILAACYRAAYLLHHAVCLRPGKHLSKSKLIVIGSFRAGGAGKTPFCLWLAQQLISPQAEKYNSDSKSVAILCHKYAFDEIRLYREKLSDQIQQGKVKVVSTKNRYKAALALDGKADFILCDDGFEDSRLQPDIIYRLDWENPPNKTESLIPLGRFRSLVQDHLKDAHRTIRLQCRGENPDLTFSSNTITNCMGKATQVQQAVVVCGLGDPERFICTIKNAEVKIIKTIIRPDHDHNFYKVIDKVLNEYPKEKIIISEKDSFRLSQKLRLHPQIHILRQSIQISENLLKKLNISA